jgi:hypothetical protein
MGRVPGEADGRKKSPAYEIRWLNLCGFCLRPGFGYPGDDFRIEQARRIYAPGLTFGNQVQCEIEWWIFWGRVAGGLNRNQQTDVYQRLSGVPAAARQKKPPAHQRLAAARDVARAASLELLPATYTPRASSGVSRASARAGCSTGRTTRCCRPRRRSAGSKRFFTFPWPPSVCRVWASRPAT